MAVATRFIGFFSVSLLVGAVVLVLYINRPIRSAAGGVAVPQVAAVSPEPGYIYQTRVSVGEHVEAGQTLVVIKRRAEPGSQTAVISPCSCQVLEIMAQSGQETSEGEPLVYLAPLRADVVVQAVFPPGADLAVGEIVEVRFEGNKEAGQGRINAIGSRTEVVGLYGLPAELLEMVPDYQVVAVGELAGIRGVRPGDAATVTTGWRFTPELVGFQRKPWSSGPLPPPASAFPPPLPLLPRADSDHSGEVDPDFGGSEAPGH